MIFIQKRIFKAINHWKWIRCYLTNISSRSSLVSNVRFFFAIIELNIDAKFLFTSIVEVFTLESVWQISVRYSSKKKKNLWSTFYTYRITNKENTFSQGERTKIFVAMDLEMFRKKNLHSVFEETVFFSLLNFKNLFR
jgi:hypothetical protein